MKLPACLSLIPLLLLLPSCATPELEGETRLPGNNVLTAESMAEARRGQVDFATHVRPILREKCVICHDADSLPGHVQFGDRASAVRTGVLGAFIVPGHPEKSRLLSQVGGLHAGVKSMPPVGEVLTGDEVVILRRWVLQGAEWPADAAGKVGGGL